MAKGIVCSPKEKIPLFKLMCDPHGVRSVEYRNKRTGQTEQKEVTEIIVFLMELQMMYYLGRMIYSPTEHIPMGVMIQDTNGIFFIEVKEKGKMDRIRLSHYIALLLDADAQAQKAS